VTGTSFLLIHTGYLSYDEFRNVIKSLECNISENQITEVRETDRQREAERQRGRQTESVCRVTGPVWSDYSFISNNCYAITILYSAVGWSVFYVLMIGFGW
jgi:hypothetical protein